MRVLHLVGGDLSGGAARGAYWLHRGLLKHGVESKILTDSLAEADVPDLEGFRETKVDKIFHYLRLKVNTAALHFYRNRSEIFYTLSFFGHDFSKHPLYHWAEIINLHWLNSGFISMKAVGKVKKPLVWTMRDMWPMTGGCHYAMHCQNYRDGCGNCYLLGSQKAFDLSRMAINNKKKHLPRDMVMVGVSNWLSDCARCSSLFKDFRVETFYNNIDCQEFYPLDKTVARELLELPREKKIILTGATNINAFFKGFDKFLEAVKRLEKKEDLFLLFFGRTEQKGFERVGVEYKSLGFLDDSKYLRLAYAAADVFVAPSIMDALPKTPLEAMACGIPVVCFDATGLKDIVDHRKNGYRAEAYSSADLARGIKWVLEHEEPGAMARAARQKALDRFDLEVVAKRYESLYTELLEK